MVKKYQESGNKDKEKVNGMKEEHKTRMPAVAGSFYSSDKEILKEEIKSFLDDTKQIEIKGKLKALIVPHAGLSYSGIVAAAGYKLLEKKVKKGKIKIERIIIVGPAHTLAFEGTALDENDYWLTPLGKIKLQGINLKEKKFNDLKKLSEAHLHEHSIEVQLPFLQVILEKKIKEEKIKLIPVIAGFTNEKLLAEDLEKLLDDNTFLIVSSDLSHYYEYNTAIRIDSNTNKCILSMDTERLKETGEACGITGIIALLYLAKKKKWKVKLLKYNNSGDTSGATKSVVGYSCIAFYK